jgi:hypothetical protein
VEIDISVTNDICHCRAKIHHKESLVTNLCQNLIHRESLVKFVL